ncbi:T2E6.13 [Arabidopsis thaliana]|uniref:T2E6.13 n=1 Tax=Arabidopsis thaliana TaxID=3702 RepID=Q9FZF6_ARATH|nr:T2E6.13 [Arabidopsis thaliana]
MKPCCEACCFSLCHMEKMKPCWLSTGDRMQFWNNGSDVKCTFCSTSIETRDHLFFSCSYASSIWTAIAKNVLQHRFSTDWQAIVNYISETQTDRIRSFLSRYIFQLTVHTVWKERNDRRHGEEPRTSANLISWMDKQIRNQLSIIISTGDRRYENGLQVWFSTRL